ncbi:hypothetical protein LC612_42880, partial [Nostoc sp. CHAB 5834]|nr:hypothetical protein [Nostoc sp. CHAB 5834]
SIAEFWQRWHISLSTFLKEYLYIPMGGNRKGRFNTYRNLFITMVLGGLWHGAAWSYAVWGAYHGLALAIERYVMQGRKPVDTWLLSFLKGCMVFTVVSFGWLLFKLPIFWQAVLYCKTIFLAPFYSTDKDRLLLIFLYSMPVIVYHAIYIMDNQFSARFHKNLSASIYAILLFLILFNSGTSGSFIYFQF